MPMLDFGFSEILLTSAIALVVLGPERLPKVARQVGNWMGRARAMARQLSEQLDREVSADELMRQRTRRDAPGVGTAPGASAEMSAASPVLPNGADGAGPGTAAAAGEVSAADDAPHSIKPPND